MANLLLERAAHQRPLASPRGALERLFTLMFQGFVYNQIWEDPSVDLEALQLKPHHRVVTIASGGCNILNYLAHAQVEIAALDLNPNHVALTRLKLAALAHLPTHESFFRFFGAANAAANVEAFDGLLAQTLDEETRIYWQKKVGPMQRRRIEMFARGLYHHGLMGRFIGLLHGVARLHGKKLDAMLTARTPREQRATFDSLIAPLFESRALKLISKSPISLYALGIPPAQYDALMASGNGGAMDVLRERVERLACDFPLKDNYFAWQAFGRSYDLDRREAVPAYLRQENYAQLKARIAGVSVHHDSLVDYLRRQPAQSLNRYVLLDAQDWMSPEQLTTLWAEIDRTADSRDAKVIFRTAGADSPCRKNCLPIFWRHGSITNGRAGCCTPRTVPPSMAVSMSMHVGLSAEIHAGLMDRVYRRQRHIYDFTRKYYLLGRDSLIRELDLQPGQSVVEIGCGTARNLIAIARRYPQARLYGLDASAEMLKTARHQLAQAGLENRVTLVQGLAEELAPGAFGLAGFDHAMFSYSLSMIPLWREAIFAAAKAVSPQGLIHIVDFGDLKTMPGRQVLRWWLGLFHVTPRGELLEALEREVEKAGKGLSVLPGRYAFRLRLAKGKWGTFGCGETDTGGR